MTLDAYGNTLPGYHNGREDILEPLQRYKEGFRQRFAGLAAETFEQLLQNSGVDAAANAELCTAIRKLENSKDRLCSSRSCCVFLLVVSWLAFLILGGMFFYGICGTHEQAAQNDAVRDGIICGSIALLLIPLLVLLHVRKSSLNAEITQLEEKIREQIDAAYAQMQPLNSLYTWDVIQDLIRQTVPRINFDPYFAESRLQDLRQYFDYDDQLFADRSVLFAQSGDLHGNPFVFSKLKSMHWGIRTYTGYKRISWTSRERGSDGKMRTVRHYQTLTASVTKPFPEYTTSTMLIFGNEAAPSLNFSRAPSELSGAEDTWWSNRKKKRTIKKLEELSRNLDDDSNYTIMGNREFEALFHATDRDDEVEFRLLYTALAQQETLKLLNDRETGFGDNFHFIKNGKLNFIVPAHLTGDFSLDTNPNCFHDYNLERARQTFNQRCNDYFRRIYFAMAPLLAIPLYQQTPMRKAIYTHPAEEQASYWEHEAMANYLGQEQFAAPDCVTDCILKTSLASRQSGISQVIITAYGFRAENRVDYVSVWGGDGRCHNVAVEWQEYLPVEKSSYIELTEHIGNDATEWEKRRQQLKARGYALNRAIHRKSIFCLR